VSCRQQQRLRRQHAWRQANPDYWAAWKRDTLEASRRWRNKNPDYFRNYRLRKAEEAQHHAIK
jgi:hypothetical protein